MKKISILVLAGLCLFLFLRCGNGVISPETGHQFIINGALVKNMTYNQDVIEFTIRRDSVLFNSAIVTVEKDTIASYGYGRYFRVTPADKLHPKDTLNIVVSFPSDSVTFTKDIIMPDTFHITDILPNYQNPNGQNTMLIYWTASQYASGYFVVVSNPPAVGHNQLVSYNYTMETIDPSAFTTSQGGIVYGTYSVYVASYKESFISYTGIPFSLPSGLPSGNVNGASGTIGVGVISPKDSIVVTQ